MKTYYCVTSAFDDRGRVTAAITNTLQSDQQPENTHESTHRKDIYDDWFDSAEAARDFIEQAKKA